MKRIWIISVSIIIVLASFAIFHAIYVEEPAKKSKIVVVTGQDILKYPDNNTSAPYNNASPRSNRTLMEQGSISQNQHETAKSVDTEVRDPSWANPTERQLADTASFIPNVDAESIVTRCAATVCSVTIRPSRFASDAEVAAFRKYLEGDALAVALTSTNALPGNARFSEGNGRLTATMTLDRIHR